MIAITSLFLFLSSIGGAVCVIGYACESASRRYQKKANS